MKRIIISAAMALVAIAVNGGIASGQESPPQPEPSGVPEQMIFVATPQGGYYCPAPIPGQAAEAQINRGQLVAPYAYQPAQLPQYAPVQPFPVQPFQPMPTPYYSVYPSAPLGNNAIPLPPLFPGQEVEPIEDRVPVRAPGVPIPARTPLVQQTPVVPVPVFAPAIPPAGGAPVPVRVITTITPDQVKQALAERIPIAIIDVRNNIIRNMDGHIPGDLHVSLGPEHDFAVRLAQAVPNRAIPVVFYCRDGSLSTRAAALALGAGYRPYLMGAYQGW